MLECTGYSSNMKHRIFVTTVNLIFQCNLNNVPQKPRRRLCPKRNSYHQHLCKHLYAVWSAGRSVHIDTANSWDKFKFALLSSRYCFLQISCSIQTVCNFVASCQPVLPLHSNTAYWIKLQVTHASNTWSLSGLIFNTFLLTSISSW